MCGRFIPLTTREFADVLRDLGIEAQVDESAPEAAPQPAKPVQPQLPFASLDEPAQPQTTPPDAFPGSLVPVAYLRDDAVRIALRHWGFALPWSKGPVFNARIEKAREDGNVWNRLLHDGRCLVGSRGFFEPHATQTMPSKHTGKPIKVPYLFTLPHQETLLMAGLCDQEAFSILTCAPNRWVAPIHDRMPVVLDESAVPMWLGDGAPDLSDCADVELVACAQR